MNKNYTLKELADIGAKAACFAEKESKCTLCHAITVDASKPLYEETSVNREAFAKAVLDAIGYEFPKDEEREAFNAWWKANRIAFCNEEHAFQLWKAGREELRKAGCSAQCKDTKTEPDWIPWDGGDKSPIVGKQTRCEVRFRDGVKWAGPQNDLRWAHRGSLDDIIFYRILD